MSLVSCICVTKNPWNLIERAINCYLAQTYESCEMVILYESNHCDKNQLEKLTDNRQQIKLIEIPIEPKKTLGELRNIAIEQSSGEYFIQWDDDDWFHPNRIAYQMSQITKRYPCNMLRQWMMFDQSTKQSYLSFKRPWEGSLLCSKKTFLESTKYAGLSKAEDTQLMQNLRTKGFLKLLDQPQLYIYTYHGQNTWNYQHFKQQCGHRTSKNLDSSIGQTVIELLAGSNDVQLTNNLDLLFSQK